MNDSSDKASSKQRLRAELTFGAPLKRMLYQPGMLLSPEELNAEQQYFLQRQRRHNRFLRCGEPAVTPCGYR
jgi:hypothetical protein